MRRIAIRVALVAGSLSLLVTGLLVIGSPDTPQEVPIAVAAADTADYLAFERNATTGVAQVAYYKGVGAYPGLWGTPYESVPLALDNRCIVTNLVTGSTSPPVAPVADLLHISITGTNANGVQLISNGLGSPGSGKCSRSGGRLLQGQQMVLKVGTSLPGMGFANAHLNVEAKFGASLEYKLGDGAFTSGGVLKSGDNGPDSGDGDNNIVLIAGPATSLSIRPGEGTGQIALEHGGDGPLGRTYFKLVPLVNCGDAASGPAGIGSIGSATFKRLDNKDSAECTPITLDIEFETGVTIDDALHDVITMVPGEDVIGGVNKVRARVELVWKVDRLDAGTIRTPEAIDLELQRQIQYPHGDPQLITYCDSAERDGNGNVVGNPVHGPSTDLDFQAWCMISDTRQLVGDQIVQTIVMDVNGDPRMF